MRPLPTSARTSGSAPRERCGRYPLLSALVAVVALSSGAGCAKTYAAAPRPDLSGVWDVAYDDYLDAELRIGERVQRIRLGRDGGRLVASDGSLPIELEIDCSREELVCPNEVWPSELTLNNRAGDFDDEGEHLTVSLAGEGSGPCVLKGNSVLGASVMSLGSARDGTWQATTLSLGRVTTVVSGRCLGADGAAGRIQIALSSGVSALRR